MVATEHPVPELAAVYRGVEEVGQFWLEWLAARETITFEYELIDARDRVLRAGRPADAGALHRHRDVGRQGRTPLHVQKLVDRVLKAYRSQSDALEAVRADATRRYSQGQT